MKWRDLWPRREGAPAPTAADSPGAISLGAGPPPGRPRVPLFGSWRNAYFTVVAIFVLEVGFFYFVSRYFL